MMDANPHHNLNPYLNLAALMPPGRNPPSVAELIQIQNQIRMAALIGQQMLPPSQHPLLTAPPAFPTLHPAQYPFSPQLPPSFNEHILNWARASSATGASVDGMGDQRRGRQTYTRYQTAALEKEFSMHTYLSRARRIVISDMLNLSERQIKIWFQNRRMKHKREQQGAASVSGVDKSPTHKKPSIPGLSPTDDHRAEGKERTTDPNSNVIDSEVNKSSHSPSSETGKVEEKPNKECDDSISMDSDGELILEQIDKKNQH